MEIRGILHTPNHFTHYALMGTKASLGMVVKQRPCSCSKNVLVPNMIKTNIRMLITDSQPLNVKEVKKIKESEDPTTLSSMICISGFVILG
jgi:hypothetical protein